MPVSEVLPVKIVKQTSMTVNRMFVKMAEFVKMASITIRVFVLPVLMGEIAQMILTNAKVSIESQVSSICLFKAVIDLPSVNSSKFHLVPHYGK